MEELKENRQMVWFHSIEPNRFTASPLAKEPKNQPIKVDDNRAYYAALTKITEPQEIIKVLLTFQPHSAQISMAELRSRGEHLKVKRYRDCIYFGEVNKQDQNHGKGIMLYSSGRIYEGDWEYDKKSGKGFEFYANGDYYEGYFVFGKPEGTGVYRWLNGEVYYGDFRKGLKDGNGTWKGTKGESYVGEWKDDKADGAGCHIWQNGDRYEGRFKRSLKQGYGTEKFANGDLYVGNFINGKPEGYGEYHWQDGSFYKGSFKNGRKHGHGVMKQWSGGGQGQRRTKDSGREKGGGDRINGKYFEVYEGNYSNDRKMGYGEYKWGNGSAYKGNFYNDMRHGYGEMSFADGTCYKGIWGNDKQGGEGMLPTPGKEPLSGNIENNQLVELRRAQSTGRKKQQHQKSSPLLDTEPNQPTIYRSPVRLELHKYPTVFPLYDTVRTQNTLPRLGTSNQDGSRSKRTLSHSKTRGDFSDRSSPEPYSLQSTNKSYSILTSGLHADELHRWIKYTEQMNLPLNYFGDPSDPATLDKIRATVNPTSYYGASRSRSGTRGKY